MVKKGIIEMKVWLYFGIVFNTTPATLLKRDYNAGAAL